MNLSRRAFTQISLTSASSLIVASNGLSLLGARNVNAVEPTIVISIRMDLPRETFQAERTHAGPDYVLSEPKELDADPDAEEARFIEPVTLIATLTIAVLVERLIYFAMTKYSQGVMVDARVSPPHVSTLAGVPQGFIILISPDGKTQTVRADVLPDTLSDLLAPIVKPIK